MRLRAGQKNFDEYTKIAPFKRGDFLYIIINVKIRRNREARE